MNVEKAKSYMLEKSCIESMNKTAKYINSLDFNDESYAFVLMTIKSVKDEFKDCCELIEKMIKLIKLKPEDCDVTMAATEVYLEEQGAMLDVIRAGYRFIETCAAIEESKNIKQYN